MNRRRAAVVLIGSIGLAAFTAASRAEEVEAPKVEVIGHYETGIGTSDAASEGSVTYKRIESRPLLRPGEVQQHLFQALPRQSGLQ